jgi:hypothetical protein
MMTPIYILGGDAQQGQKGDAEFTHPIVSQTLPALRELSSAFFQIRNTRLMTSPRYQLDINLASRGDAMPRRPATVTQADVARVIRAAQQAGADAVEVQPDGKIRIVLSKPEDSTGSLSNEVEIVL